MGYEIYLRGERKLISPDTDQPQIDPRRYGESVFLAILDDRLGSGTPEERAQIIAKLETTHEAAPADPAGNGRLGSEAGSRPYSDADALAIRRFGAGQAGKPGDAILDRAAQYWQLIVRSELKEALANVGRAFESRIPAGLAW